MKGRLGSAVSNAGHRGSDWSVDAALLIWARSRLREEGEQHGEVD